MNVITVKITHMFSECSKYREFTQQQYNEYRDTIITQHLPIKWEVIREREL